VWSNELGFIAKEGEAGECWGEEGWGEGWREGEGEGGVEDDFFGCESGEEGGWGGDWRVREEGEGVGQERGREGQVCGIMTPLTVLERYVWTSPPMSVACGGGGGGGAVGRGMDQMATFEKFLKRKQARTREGAKKEKKDAFLVSENVLECTLSRNLLGHPQQYQWILDNEGRHGELTQDLQGYDFCFCNMIKKYAPTYTYLLFNIYIFKGIFFLFLVYTTERCVCLVKCNHLLSLICFCVFVFAER
jgi:hypothetical protein